VLKHLFDGEADVSCDLPEQGRRNVSAGMEGDGCAATIRMSVLFVSRAGGLQ
jgi:hypothetical protein